MPRASRKMTLEDTTPSGWGAPGKLLRRPNAMKMALKKRMKR